MVDLLFPGKYLVRTDEFMFFNNERSNAMAKFREYRKEHPNSPVAMYVVDREKYPANDCLRLQHVFYGW